jgi:hypothetical protein
MTKDQCEQLDRDLKKSEGISQAMPVPYEFGAGKKPTWGANQ